MVTNVTLNDNTRLVVIQFNGSNPNIVPNSVKDLGIESQGDRTDRVNPTVKGIMTLEPTENCGIGELLYGLEAVGYELVDASSQERNDPKDHTGKRKYFAVRFVLAKHEFAQLSEHFSHKRDAVRDDLAEMCSGSMWRIRAFDNPFFQGGKEIEGQRCINVDLHARTPLYKPDGQPVLVHGNPIKADHSLKIANGAITVS